LGGLMALVFVRRQQRLDDPLLDMRLFGSRTFSAALIVLLVGLVGVSGVMLLVTQYLQLVAGLTPLAAGLWMGPPALAMVLAGIMAPLIARRIRPGYVVGAALALSTLGYWLLAAVEVNANGVGMAIAGFSLVYLGLGTIAALGTDLVVGAAPAEKAGSASAMSEMVQELGVALGVALLGSLATFVYRAQVSATMADGEIAEAAEVVEESLWATVSAGESLPAGVLLEAQQAFTAGLNVTATVGGIAILALSVVSIVSLRHVGAIGGEAREASGEKGEPCSPVS
ncbi:MAG: MFS transporter, partial [Billgrantia sp.]